ncbi:50S ribosomal protein L35 [candidate division WWE3 bacterium]|uniref:50S ribosomal protein L35 n=1 Tax=candidate division WWE3 bacterium TaxID=2053526 RepID=A0A7X9HHB1_UNCKA|nr:50S ribosomal protein L35 [candidate division WWE3 bacterium]
MKNKLKTRKTLTKRIRVTNTGKLVKKQSSQGHLKEKRDTSRKLRKKHTLVQSNKGHIRILRRLLAKAGK